MSRYPEIQTTSTPRGNKFKAISKTKMPCGATVMTVREEPGAAWVAELYAKRECEGVAAVHIHEHKCDK